LAEVVAMAGRDQPGQELPPQEGVGDAAALARVAILVEQAGLPLDADQIRGLLPAYRDDRAIFGRLREMIEPEDEPAVTFRADPEAGPPGGGVR
jgi:hypothetical protein